MKKGLRNTIASLALSGMSLFGGIKQANADNGDYSVEEKAKIVEMAKILERNTVDHSFEEKARQLLNFKEKLPKFLKSTRIYEFGGDVAKNLERFLIEDKEMGGYKIDFSKSEKVLLAATDSKVYVALNHEDKFTPQENSIFLEMDNDGILHMTNADPGTIFLETAKRIATIDTMKKTFQIEWLDGGKTTTSPEMNYTQAKEKVATKIVAPSARKAISERLQKN